MADGASAKRTASSSEIDLDEAKRFLDLLGAEQATFQTYDDQKGNGLARIRHGTLAEHAKELSRLNSKGACISISVNTTDLKGAKRENIVATRALFLDLDWLH